MPVRNKLTLSEDTLEEAIKIIYELVEDRGKLITVQPTLIWPGIKTYWDMQYAAFTTEYVELFDKAKLNEL